jgi:hypothetical protein
MQNINNKEENGVSMRRDNAYYPKEGFVLTLPLIYSNILPVP